MAEAYFGERKDLDEMIEAFGRMAEQVQALRPHVLDAAARMDCLLLDRETANSFYQAIGVDSSRMSLPAQKPRPIFPKLPFAFTGHGRYERCVFRVYDLFHSVADEYLNGRHFDDPEYKGRKRLTPHYLRIKSLAEHLNVEIDKVNQRSVCGALQYVKNMDPEHARQERLMGDTDCRGDALNRDLQFVRIDFEALQLLEIPDLPPLYKVKAVLKTFCSRVYEHRRDEAIQAMQRLVES
ncbi:hypothetical protein [Pseudodesulfovibrio sp.]|uniref:hypothetical protein n=1 Tax=unclassified Pseudodesulfovibrio TaxID=2661612 RepID=UPI003B009509